MAYCNEGKAIWAQAIENEDVQGWFQDTGRYYLDPITVSAQETERLRRQYGWFLSVLRAERLIEKYPPNAPTASRTSATRFPIPCAPPSCAIPGMSPGPSPSTRQPTAPPKRAGGGRGDAKWTVMCDEFGERSDPVVQAAMVPDADPHTRGLVEWITGMESMKDSGLDAWITYDRLCNAPESLEALCEVFEIADYAKTMEYHKEILTSGSVTYDDSDTSPLMQYAKGLHAELSERSL